MALTSKKEPLYNVASSSVNVSVRPVGILNGDLRTVSDHFDSNFSLTKLSLKCLMSNFIKDKSTL
jgi:hypothetical protein